MQCSLMPHPGSPPSPVETVNVDVGRLADGRIGFVYMAVGDIERLRVPPAAAPVRADGLWRHTCFEAFVQPLNGEAYFEFNFAPSFEWAAYRFDSYRSGMAPADAIYPLINCMIEADHIALIASVDAGPLHELVPWEEWHIGLSAVIEAEDGTISHWALAHPPGAADFHDRSCFRGQLAPAATL